MKTIKRDSWHYKLLDEIIPFPETADNICDYWFDVCLIVAILFSFYTLVNVVSFAFFGWVGLIVVNVVMLWYRKIKEKITKCYENCDKINFE